MSDSTLKSPERPNWRIDLRPFWALLRWELGKLARSWVLRLWLLLTSLMGILLVAVSAGGESGEPASVLLSNVLALYLTFGSVVFIIVSASSVASEREEVASSIMWRPVARHHYILSKLASLAMVTLALYALVAAPAGYFMDRYHPGSDLTLAGVAFGILTIGMLLVMLVALGVAVSTLSNSTVMAVVLATLTWLALGLIFSLLDVGFLSPASLLEKLPRVMAGEFSAADQWQIVGGFAGLTALFWTLAVLAFFRQDF